MFKDFLLKINFFLFLIFFIKMKIFLYKRIFFSYQKDFFIKNLISCLNCHETINYNLYSNLYKTPIIKNQNREYLSDSINSYKNFERKSPYMNFITQDLSNLDIWYLSSYFSLKNEKYKR